MIYSALTPAQQAQAHLLFHDDIFGTDPHAYDYELKGDVITGRAAISNQRLAVSNIHAKKVRNVRVTMTTVEVINPESDTQYVLQLLARKVFERINQIQYQEA